MYLRLTGIDEMRWRDRTHFFAMAATLMRGHGESNVLDGLEIPLQSLQVAVVLDGRRQAAAGTAA